MRHFRHRWVAKIDFSLLDFPKPPLRSFDCDQVAIQKPTTIFLRKISLSILNKSLKTIGLTQKSKTIVILIAKTFNHSLFWKKKRKNNKRLYNSFTFFKNIPFWFAFCRAWTLLSIRDHNLARKETIFFEISKIIWGANFYFKTFFYQYKAPKFSTKI